MKSALLFIFMIIGTLCHSQIIDQHVIPFPRRVDDVKLVIHLQFPNSTNKDSSDVFLDTISHKVLVNGYYTPGPWPSPCVEIDTIDLSNYLDPGNYEIKFVLKLHILDTLTVLWDSITHRIMIEPSSSANNEYINVKCNIFPNPTTTSINVIVTTEDRLNNVYFKLINNQGRVLKDIEKKQINSGENTITIPLEDVKPGMYILLVKSGNNMIYRKIIKL